jgi:hypothetical protein
MCCDHNARARRFEALFAQLTLCVLLAVAGCSQAATSAKFDGDEARKTLTDALDAWKEGRARELAQASPPIRFVDDDLASGARLVSYECEATANSFRAFQNVPVTLMLEDRAGKTKRKTVTYQVALAPRLAVLRSEK